MEFTEFTKKPLELRIYGQDVKLNKPTFGIAKEWEKKIKGAGENALDMVGDMLVACGMPADLLEQLEIDHIQTIQGLLLPSKKN